MLKKLFKDKPYGAEFIGTFLLVYLIFSVVVVIKQGAPANDSTKLLVISGGLFVLAWFFGTSHFNPGLSLGDALANSKWPELPGRWLAQLAGSCAAVLVVWYFVGVSPAGLLKLLTAALVKDSYKVAASELLGSLVFYSAVLHLSSRPPKDEPDENAASAEKNRFESKGFQNAIGSGLTLGLMAVSSGFAGGGVLNPAIILAPMLVAWVVSGFTAGAAIFTAKALLVLVVVPLVAGLIAGSLFRNPSGNSNRRDKIALQRQPAARQA